VYNEQSPLSEDDHFAQVAATLPAVKLPMDPALNNDNFEEVIGRYDTSVVVYYMPCKPIAVLMSITLCCLYQGIPGVKCS